MVVVSIILPVATKLVEQNQENRSKAAVVADGGGGGSLSSCSSKNGGFCAASCSYGYYYSPMNSSCLAKYCCKPAPPTVTPRPPTPTTKPECSSGQMICRSGNVYSCSVAKIFTRYKDCGGLGCEEGSDTYAYCKIAPTPTPKPPTATPKPPIQTCTLYDYRCNGNRLEWCNDPNWVLAKDCGTNGCDSAKKDCKPTVVAPICGVGQYKCDGQKILICNSTQNGWNSTPVKTCAVDESCDYMSGTCKKVCSPTYCGNCTNSTDCGYKGCYWYNNTCNKTPAPVITCSDNGSNFAVDTKRCIDNKIKTCLSTTRDWSLGTPCLTDQQCNPTKTACVDKPAIVCTTADTKCIDGGRTLYYCDTASGIMKEKYCSTDGCDSVNKECKLASASILITQITTNPVSVNSIIVGQSQKILTTVYPSTATIKELFWLSSDASIVSVDLSGNIKAIKPGNTFIKVSSKDGSKIETKINITVVTDSVTTTSTNKPQSCTSNDTKCIDGGRTLYYCDSTSGVMKEKYCTNGCDSVNKECKSSLVCSANQTRCVNNLGLETCNSTNTGWTLSPCPWGCNFSTNSCNLPPEKVCTANNQYRCDGRNLMVCNSTGSGWLLSKECGIDQICNVTTKSCDSKVTVFIPKIKCDNENRICVHNLFTCADKYSGKVVEGTDCASICCEKTISKNPTIITDTTSVKLSTCCGLANNKSFTSLSLATSTGLCNGSNNGSLFGSVTNTATGWKWVCKSITSTNRCFTDNCTATKTSSSLNVAKTCTDQKGVCLPINECKADNGLSIGKFDCVGTDICCQPQSPKDTSCTDQKGECISNIEVDNCEENEGKIVAATECSGLTPVCCQNDYIVNVASNSQCNPNKKNGDYYLGCKKYQTCREDISLIDNTLNKYYRCYDDGICADSNKSFSLANPPTQVNDLCVAGTSSEVKLSGKLYYWYCIGKDYGITHLCFANITENLRDISTGKEPSVINDSPENNLDKNTEKLSLLSTISSSWLDAGDKEKLISIVNQYNFNNPEDILLAKATVNLYFSKKIEDYIRSFPPNRFYMPKSATTCGPYGCQSPLVYKENIYDPENIIPKVKSVLSDSEGKTNEQINQDVINVLTTNSSSFDVVWADFSQPQTEPLLVETSDGKYVYYSFVQGNPNGMLTDSFLKPESFPENIDNQELCPAGKLCVINSDIQNSLEAVSTILHEYGHYVEYEYILPEYRHDENITETEFLSSLYGIQGALLTGLSGQFDDQTNLTNLVRLENQIGLNNWVLYGTVAP